MNIPGPAHPAVILAAALFIRKTERLIGVADTALSCFKESLSSGHLQKLPVHLIKNRGITRGSLEAISGFQSGLEQEGGGEHRPHRLISPMLIS